MNKLNVVIKIVIFFFLFCLDGKDVLEIILCCLKMGELCGFKMIDVF